MKKVGKRDVETCSLLSWQLVALIQKIDSLKLGNDFSSDMSVKAMASASSYNALICDACAILGITLKSALLSYLIVIQCMHCNHNISSSSIHAPIHTIFGMRDHPNISYRSNNVLNQHQ